ncbi:sensor histidine kinase [Paenibacillus polysaccharolyticus]|uniref:sensor histidine kinase n=1 Tax=Paenibacillus polysaccharolyticus TaxID=582692 RepID=UPI00300A2D39
MSAIILLFIIKKHNFETKKKFIQLTFLVLTFSLCDSLPLFFLRKMSLSGIFEFNFILVFSMVFSSVILKLISISIYRIIYLQQNNLRKILNIALLMTLILTPLISLLILGTSVANLKEEYHVNGSILFIIINICILYLYFTLGSTFEKLEKTRAEKHFYESELNFFKQLQHSQSRLYSIKHDLKNQYIVLSGMLGQGDISGAEKYIQESVNKLHNINNFYTNNYVLNYLLNQKKTVAQENGVSLNIESFFPEKIELDNDILAIVLGNLIDNSLSAVLRLDDPNERKISLIIKQFNKNLLIEISNVFDLNEIRTRKKRLKEGIGIKNITRIVEENGGIYSQWVSNNQYIVSILLLNVYDND